MMVLLPAVGVVSMSVAASAAAACPEQCSLNGMCLPSGACQCDTPWTGANCGVLERLAVNATQHPGAAIFGYSPNVSSWGGSILTDERGLHHLFVAQMQTGGLIGWGSESECVHATSTSLGGPFSKQSVLVPKECHGPVVLRAPDGEYLMLHQGDGRGSDRNTSSPADFMHHSSSPAGPWVPTTTTPASLDPAGRGCGMPTAAFHPNGTLFVVCGNGHGLYAADTWNGHWRLVTALVTPPKWEDPTLWFDRRGNWHIVYHVWAAEPFEAHHEPASGHGFSSTGSEWTFSTTQPFTGTVNFTDGTSKQFATRERPQMIFTDAARHTPVGLTSAVSPQPLGPWCKECKMGACSQCKVSPGRDWTYTIFQALRTSESTAESIQSTMKSDDDDRAMPTARTAGATTAGMTVSVDSSHVLFEVSDRGEAGLMEDLGCAVEDTCPFGKAWFKQRLTQLGKGGGNSMRLGGGAQACALYNVTGKLILDANVTNSYVIKHYCKSRFPIIIDAEFWDSVLDDLTAANVTLIFGVNFAIGRANPDPSGAPPKDQHWSPVSSGFDELLKYTAKRSPNAVFAFELGNEPRSGKFGYMPSGETYAADCAALRSMVKTAYWPLKHAGAPTSSLMPKVVCGDWSCEAEPNSKKPLDQWWAMVDGLNKAATAPIDGDAHGSVDALSLHWYPASSEDKHDAKEDLNATRLDAFSDVFTRFKQDIAAGWKGEVWAGETASLQNGGGDSVSNAFQSTTWLWDQLGQQGEAGISRMLRESISVGRYAQVNSTDGTPFPDFFSTLLWREVVGSKVLSPMDDTSNLLGERSTTTTNKNTRIDNRGKELRVYSRCARTSAAEVVLVIVNLSPTVASTVTVGGVKPGSQQKEWLLTAGTGTEVWSWGRSKEVELNGNVLGLSKAGEPPQMLPRKSLAGAAVIVAPLSVALIQYEPTTGAKACAP